MRLTSFIKARFRKDAWEGNRRRFTKMAEAEDSPGQQEATSSKPLFAGLSDVSISQDIPIEGEITIPSRTCAQECDNSTLNESIRQTIMRDLKAVGRKFMHVLYPRKSNNTLLRDWDLWGPLILCVSLALMLQKSSVDGKSDSGSPEFAEVFVIIWFGAVTITLNSKLLGGNMAGTNKLPDSTFCRVGNVRLVCDSIYSIPC